MNNLFKLPEKKTLPKYSFPSKELIKKGQGTTDTGDPTSPLPLTTTHVFERMR